MISLTPALILAFVSFITSAFVILRIVIPILPPHPLSKRVSPAEFGLPTFRSLSPADKSHLWLAALDLIALSLFIWQIVNESTAGPSGVAVAVDPGSAIRLWIAVTLRQTCLLVVASVTLLHVRMAQSVSFGPHHWMIWAPVALLVVTSTTVAGLLAETGVYSLFYGLTAYTAAIAALTSVAFGCLIRTLFSIKKNLASMNEPEDAWPPVRQMEEKPRPSFATEEIDAIRDGASWITSNASSRRESVSAWSFTTHQTITTTHHGSGRPQSAMHPSVPAKSSFWFGSTTPNDIEVPPVPPLPSPYGPLSPTLAESDPFRRDLPPLPTQQKPRMGSQSSWLTSSNGSHTTISAWSYPATMHEGTIRHDSTPDLRTVYSPTPEPRPVTPALAHAQVLGGYGYAPGGLEVEKGLAALAAPAGTTLDITMTPAYGWSVMIWLPLSFSLPYLIVLSQNTTPSTAFETLFILSVTLSSPLLALNLLFGSPLPIPIGLFDVRESSLPMDPNRPMIHGSLPTHKFSHEYKRSTSCSVTVVEGRRSGDVWLSKGDAIDGKGKLGRAMTLLSPAPKLSVLPLEEKDDELDMPPVPIRDDSLPVHVNGTPQSDNSVQFGRFGKESKTSHHNSGPDESLAFASRIMIAQRHYSALAQTVVVPAGGNVHEGYRGSVDANTLVSVASGTANKRVSQSSHLRSRSVASSNPPDTPTAQERFNFSPPPPFPLPPTPPSVKAARLAMLAHKKSFSSGNDFSFKTVDDINEIDAMTAGVLPLLVPGLTVGENMKIKTGDYTPPGTYSKSKGKKVAKKLTEFGEDFSSPEVHSTPARTRQPRARKQSGHKKNHFSLPSLGLGKDGIQSFTTWGTDIRNALEGKAGQYTAVASNIAIDTGRRNTIVGVEASHLQSVQEEEEKSAKPVARSLSTRSLGLRADVPHNIDSDTARSSVASIVTMPPSAASTVTLFEEFEAGLHMDPHVQSTPHSSLAQKPSRHPAPPMPGRSSIRYIKSDNDSEPTTYPFQEHTAHDEAIHQPSQSAISSLAQWSSRAVRPLMAKTTNHQAPVESTSPKDGLRSLTLLQDRGKNTESTVIPTAEIRPLSLGKRQKFRPARQDENANPKATTPRHKNLKSLTLVRSETAKMRGILRKTEVLPDVVIRPPSTSEHTGYSYSFHD